MVSNTAKVAIKLCEVYDVDLIEMNLQEMLDQIYDLKANINENTKVLIKPNLVSPLTPDKAATTHPAVVEAVVRILKTKGAKNIWIGDSGIHGTSKIFEVCGMNDIAQRYDCQICDFDNDSIDNVHNQDNFILKNIPLTRFIRDCDLIINMPKTKIHHAVLYTGAIKNLYGTIVGKNKMKLHANLGTKDNFENALLDLFTTVAPTINIMDGIVGMEGNGPANGKPVRSNMLLASTNGLALDIVAMSQIGIGVRDVGYIEKGLKRKMAPRPSEIEIIGDQVPLVSYEKPSAFLVKLNGFVERVTPSIYQHMKPIPKFDKKNVSSVKYVKKFALWMPLQWMGCQW
ncbi:DUF362 domain-containing protein [Fusibacter sp. JL216-2]|uniref:DUF362 domain-containing protein n=1 Tax=Fusibacter sp. JL216-2 TaxID=3071453 RepID=UPI003D33CE5A